MKRPFPRLKNIFGITVGKEHSSDNSQQLSANGQHVVIKEKPLQVQPNTFVPIVTPSHESTQPSIAGRSSVALATIGTSLEAIKMRRDGTSIDKTTEMDGTTDSIAKVFDNQELQFKWHEVCDSLPSIDVANAERMKGLKIEILSFPKLRVIISNGILEKFMLGIKPELTRALAKALGNNEISLDYHLADMKELSTKGLTRREIFTQMIQQSKGIALLQKEFDLQLV